MRSAGLFRVRSRPGRITGMDENNETVWRMSGSLYPIGGGKAFTTQLDIGDGFPPILVIRFGLDDDGATAVDLTAGGFGSEETVDETLKGIADLLVEIAAHLKENAPTEM